MKRYKTKVDVIYEILMEDIANGKYKPGERLVISQISKNNDVSDIPVREAVRRLESEGYVQMNANHGPVVGQFSGERLKEIFQIKAVLEGYASRLACDVLTGEDFVQLREYNRLFLEAGTDKKACSELNMKFHMRIYQNLRERELVNMIEELWKKYSITKRVFSMVSERVNDSYKEHEHILELMEQKEYDQVEKAVRTHKISAGLKMAGSLDKNE